VPTAKYLNNAAVIVPRTTGINEIDFEKRALNYWYYKRGLDNKPFKDDSYAKAGEVGHLLVEAAIKGVELKDKDFPTDGARELGLKSFAAYQRWQSLNKIRWTDSELSLVSEQYQYGGTIDLVGVEEGANHYSLGDIKTGKLYPQHLCQIAAYGHLFEECTGNHVANYHLLRFDRETGLFQHAYYDAEHMKVPWEAFLLKRRLYDKLKIIGKMI
jgi:hypothetical protein